MRTSPAHSPEALTEPPPPPGAETLAHAVLGVVPAIMGALRKNISNQANPYISAERHFRVLMVLKDRQSSSLSDVANFAGITLPAASKLVEELQQKNLVLRTGDSQDRRRVVLDLTPLGHEVVDELYAGAKRELATMLQSLSATETRFLCCALETLLPIFAPGRTAATSDS